MNMNEPTHITYQGPSPHNPEHDPSNNPYYVEKIVEAYNVYLGIPPEKRIDHQKRRFRCAKTIKNGEPERYYAWIYTQNKRGRPVGIVMIWSRFRNDWVTTYDNAHTTVLERVTHESLLGKGADGEYAYNLYIEPEELPSLPLLSPLPVE
jgi:hypothetical protein